MLKINQEYTGCPILTFVSKDLGKTFFLDISMTRDLTFKKSKGLSDGFVKFWVRWGPSQFLKMKTHIFHYRFKFTILFCISFSDIADYVLGLIIRSKSIFLHRNPHFQADLSLKQFFLLIKLRLWVPGWA